MSSALEVIFWFISPNAKYSFFSRSISMDQDHLFSSGSSDACLKMCSPTVDHHSLFLHLVIPAYVTLVLLNSVLFPTSVFQIARRAL